MHLKEDFHPHEALGEGGNRFLLVTITSSQKRWVIIIDNCWFPPIKKHESCFWVGPWGLDLG
jgi:hypothetical protein